MLPLPAEESEVKTNSNEVMSPPALTDEPPKKRRRSSGSGTAKGTKIRMREWVMMMMMMGRASEGSKLLYSSLQNTKLVLLCYPIFKTEIFITLLKKKSGMQHLGRI